MYNTPVYLHTAVFVNIGSNHNFPFSPGILLPTAVLPAELVDSWRPRLAKGCWNLGNILRVEMSELRRSA